MENSVQDKLKKRRQYLESLRRIVIQRNAGAPEGSLRISRSHNRIQYYHRVCESDRNGKYIVTYSHHFASLRSGGFLFDSPVGLSIRKLSPRVPRFILSARIQAFISMHSADAGLPLGC